MEPINFLSSTPSSQEFHNFLSEVTFSRVGWSQKKISFQKMRKTKTCQASVDNHLEQISPDSTLAYFVKGKLLKGFVINWMY